jgi:cyclopropane fatty-acyl-phospholipid synthase-like methyltransferase
MSAMHDVMTGQRTVKPSEQIRRLGQTMGLWNHGFDFPRSCRQLFRNLDFRGKTMLEIGCGKGVFCLWAALHGAREVVGLEPLADGAFDSSACHSDFQSMAAQLGLHQARISPATVQEFDAPDNSFDIVLSVASINHLDEKSCIKLHESPLAVKAYERIFRRIARMMKPGGKLIVVDAARRNIFGDLGVRNPLCPNIEWFKHRQPNHWAALLQGCGFGQARIRWSSGKLLRYLRINTLPKTLAYFGQSIFRLEMTRIR